MHLGELLAVKRTLMRLALVPKPMPRRVIKWPLLLVGKPCVVVVVRTLINVAATNVTLWDASQDLYFAVQTNKAPALHPVRFALTERVPSVVLADSTSAGTPVQVSSES